MKYYGNRQACEIIDLAKQLKGEVSANPDKTNDLMLIEVGVFIAIVEETNHLLRKNMFYEMGKSLALSETQDRALSKIPERYREDFLRGAEERNHLVFHERTKCEQCEHHSGALQTPPCLHIHNIEK